MLTRKIAINKILSFVSACRERDIVFSKVILFGSYAFNNHHEHSDIDVAFFSDCFSGRPFADWHLLSPVNIKFTDIEPHPFPSDDYEKGDPFIDEIKRIGIEIKI